MTNEELAEVLRQHAAWVAYSRGGKRAVFRDADLSCVKLVGANLTFADFNGANLAGANFCSANLAGAYFRGANLHRAYLTDANCDKVDFSDANLTEVHGPGANFCAAHFRGADLRGANFRGANFRGAALHNALNITPYVVAATVVAPPEGEIIGWKACARNVIVKLRVPPEARRSNATGRKCRAEFVEVLDVIGAETGVSLHDRRTVYRKGEVVRADAWKENRWVECAPGIHFFLTREEAEAWSR